MSPPLSTSHHGFLGQAGSPVLELDCMDLIIVAEGKSILGEEEMVGCEGSLWLKLPWDWGPGDWHEEGDS